jgi:hypothetical protein
MARDSATSRTRPQAPQSTDRHTDTDTGTGTASGGQT